MAPGGIRICVSQSADRAFTLLQHKLHTWNFRRRSLVFIRPGAGQERLKTAVRGNIGKLTGHEYLPLDMIAAQLTTCIAIDELRVPAIALHVAMRVNGDAGNLLTAFSLMLFEILAVIHIDDKTPARRQLAMNVAEEAAVGLLIEIAKALPHIDDRIELVGQFTQSQHVAHDIGDMLSGLL